MLDNFLEKIKRGNVQWKIEQIPATEKISLCGTFNGIIQLCFSFLNFLIFFYISNIGKDELWVLSGTTIIQLDKVFF